MTEDQLQAKCFELSWNKYPQTRRLLWAVPNGGTRNVIEATKLKACGLIAGVHDLNMLWQGRFYSFELKVGYNSQSEAQRTWGRLIVEQGGKWFEIRSVDEFEAALKSVLAI